MLIVVNVSQDRRQIQQRQGDEQGMLLDAVATSQAKAFGLKVVLKRLCFLKDGN